MTDDVSVIDENEVLQVRRQKLKVLREKGNAYPNDFKRNALAQELLDANSDKSNEDFEASPVNASIAGRVVLRRIMGKAAFIHIQDMSGRIQLYIRKDNIDEASWESFLSYDMGDIIGATGHLFKTKTQELSLKVDSIKLLTKSLRPLPDKFHGLHDTEIRYRQRYLDLIANEDSKRVFLTRAKMIDEIRQFLKDRQFLEVETPMMQPIPGGAAARPFITHHNTLDMKLFLRIAPELYLKRLVVGGFERVFEINRNFRNEGISTQHNPEFTMLEFYQAYADYKDLLVLTESMFKTLAQNLLGQTTLHLEHADIDFGKPFTKVSLKDSILQHDKNITEAQLSDLKSATKLAEGMGIDVLPHYGLGKVQTELFDKIVEAKLIQPTFITHYPREVSPLARVNDEDSFVTDRFELFIDGREIANGFSELNDPEDQAERFMAQVKDRDAGDEEAMYFDQDYITALEYGLPPTAGEGIGIDRLAMLFTQSASIRDVLLFPLLRHSTK